MGLEPYYTYYDKNNPQSNEMMETAKASKRAALLNEMNQCYQDLAKAKAQLPKLEQEKSNLNTEIKTWEGALSKYNNTSYLTKVVTPHKFEGEIARKLQDDMYSCVTHIKETYPILEELAQSIDQQISKLRQQISVINGRVKNIQNELNTL